MAKKKTPKDQAAWLTGQLLIAMPSLRDANFAQSVICLCVHSEDGAMGIVLNKPLQRLTFDALLKQLGVAPVPPARSIRMLSGGPVDGGRGFVLHSGEWSTEGSMAVDAQTRLTSSIEVLKAIAEGGGPRECVLALGYASWGPGQLEEEIGANVWLSVTPDETLLYDTKPELAWRSALAKLKVDPLLLSAAAGHA
ncbi:MAG: YqgE/AlgH family protein [Rubritepida sp.]|nr:YqgE/AlgH family protein [Rubritepida sp.]